MINDIASEDYDGLSRHWIRIVEWAADNRAFIGVESVRAIWEWLGAQNYPEAELRVFPPALRNEFRQALNQLLSRVLSHTAAKGPRRLNPAHLSETTIRDALEFDISGCAGADVAGIATREELWAHPSEVVSIDPPPPPQLALCFTPGAALHEELLAQTQDQFAEKRLIIIGGQPADRVVDAITKLTGMSRRNISWIASERTKKPRDLDKRLARLDPRRDIVVCVTGRIGHSESEAAAVAARAAGVEYFAIENRNDIANRLVTSRATASSQ